MKFVKKHDETGMAYQVISQDDAVSGPGVSDRAHEGIPFFSKGGIKHSSGKKLYAWEKDGAFFLSAFSEPRPQDGKRPAVEFNTKAAVDAEVQRRGANVIWES